MARTRATSQAPAQDRTSTASTPTPTPESLTMQDATPDAIPSAQAPDEARESIEPSDDDVEVITIDEGPNDDTNEGIEDLVTLTELSLDEEIAQIKANIARKKKEATLAALRLEEKAVDKAIETGQVLDQVDTTPAPSARSTEPHLREPSLALAKIPLYRGLSLKEHREFTKQCRKHHEVSPGSYATDERKIAIASMYLVDTVSDAWERERRRDGAAPHTWDTFVEWLRDQVEDPDNRRRTSAQELKNLRQKGGQTARQFLADVETLEDDLPLFTEEQKISNFWTGLRPSLQNAINATGREFSTREEILRCATTLEKGNSTLLGLSRRGSPTREYTTKRRMFESDRSGRAPRRNYARTGPAPPPRYGRSTPATAPNQSSIGPRTGDAPAGPCWTCNRTGHQKRDCPDRRPAQIRYGRYSEEPKN